VVPQHSRSTVLPPEEGQIICEFRRLKRLALDYVFVSLKDSIPALTRSNLHRCLKPHGLNRLPPEEGEGQPVQKKTVKQYAIGYVHLVITEICLGKQKRYLFVGIDRVCKYVYGELHERMTQTIAQGFLEHLIADCPFIIHTILMDNGAQLTYALLAEHLRLKSQGHPCEQTSTQHEIKHRLTKFRHPWANGQVEVFNQTIKAHTAKQHHYDTAEEIKQHLMAFLLVYNF
jgi:integrase-like protein